MIDFKMVTFTPAQDGQPVVLQDGSDVSRRHLCETFRAAAFFRNSRYQKTLPNESSRQPEAKPLT